MKISIVTISFNQAAFLEAAILSVFNQDYGNVEYIIVDPGSTDGSRDIIERYRDKFSKIIYEPDKGPADGLNTGFSWATGDVYGFLNSDDTLLPGSLTTVAEYLRLHPDIDLVSGHARIIDEHDRPLRNCYSDRLSLKRYAYGAVVLMQPSTFCRSYVYQRAGGFNVENKTNWDGEIFIDMLMCGAKFGQLNRFLSCYRLQPESITSSKKLDAGIKIYQRTIFKKIMGRERICYDAVFEVFYRLLKHVSNPRALYERINKGPVYGRGKR